MASRKVELVIKGIQALTKDEKQELAVLLAQEFNFSERTEALESLSESFTKDGLNNSFAESQTT